MKEFKGKVAVVTGAASGIGRAMALRFAAEGMKVVLADIDSDPLAETESDMKQSGANVIAVRTDVSKGESVETLARETLKTFGAVHIICNNAGVGSPPGPIWERTVADWQWVFGVNLWGVVNGIRLFVPLMLKQGGEGHIVNTASMSGFLSSPFLGIYNATKHAVVAISETLHSELAISGSQIKVSVLCPGVVQTQIANSERNRPAELANPTVNKSSFVNSVDMSNRPGLGQGITPGHVADCVMQAIRDEQLYILTHPGYKPLLRTHMEEILGEQNPNRTESRAERLQRLQRSRAR